MRPKQFLSVAVNSVRAWQSDYASSMGAAIAFYTVFSITPLLVLVIAIAGAVWGDEAVRGEIFRQLGGLVGSEGAAGVQSLLRNADKPEQGIAASTISVLILIWGATRVFAELQSALDRIWQLPAVVRKAGLWHTIRARLLSFGLILGLAFLMLVSLLVGAGVAAIGGYIGGLLPGWELVLQVINLLMSLAASAVLFAMIFKYMPQVRLAWRDVWVGAWVTAVLFEIGKFIIAMYLGKSSTISSLTAAGSLIIVLVWVYYAAQVFLLGAEFTWYYANHYGSRADRVQNDSSRKENVAAPHDSGKEAQTMKPQVDEKV